MSQLVPIKENPEVHFSPEIVVMGKVGVASRYDALLHFAITRGSPRAWRSAALAVPSALMPATTWSAWAASGGGVDEHLGLLSRAGAELVRLCPLEDVAALDPTGHGAVL